MLFCFHAKGAFLFLFIWFSLFLSGLCQNPYDAMMTCSTQLTACLLNGNET